jgi:uncharacterized membrane protein YeiB
MTPETRRRTGGFHLSTMNHTSRIPGIDLARALAVFGMVFVDFKTVMGSAQFGPGWLVSIAGFLDGRAGALFVMLAGVGVSLMTQAARDTWQSAEIDAARRRILRRALFLFVFGLLYTALWPADILHFYALYFILAAFLFMTPDRTLWLAALACLLGAALVFFRFNIEFAWAWLNPHYRPLWTVPGMLRHLLFNGFYPVLPWAGFLFLGMWLGRQNLLRRVTRRRIVRRALGVAVGIELLSMVILEFQPWFGPNTALYLFGTSPVPPLPLFFISAAASAVAMIALCVQWGLTFNGTLWMDALAATGRLSLTLYVLHVLLGMSVLAALGLLENQPIGFALGSALLFFLLMAPFAYWWLEKFNLGPLEGFMRRVAG